LTESLSPDFHDSLLICGPPASGKSRAALDHFLSNSASVLVTPSATMAEHIRNQLARAGLRVRPSRVLTLAHFLDRLGAPAAPSTPALNLAIEEALDRLRPPRFQAVAEYRGFRGVVAALLDEIALDETSAGKSGRAAIPPDLARLFGEVESALAMRDMATRSARLSAAAGSSNEPPSQIVFDGFFTLSDAELKFVESLAARTRVIVTLPEWPGAANARARLIAAGFGETRLTHVYRTPSQEAFCAPTLEQETEEIARRILDEAARGVPLHDIGIVLRTRDPYAPALESTLARFGIPVRFYFADPLASHPAIDFLGGIVRGTLNGWDHDALLRLLRMPVSGLGASPEGDRFDFELRERLPGRGLPIPELPADSGFNDSLAALNSWPRDRLSAKQWAASVKTLRAMIPAPASTSFTRDEISTEQLEASLETWRSTAAALDAFDAALDEAGAALAASGPIALAEFWRQAEAVLELTELRVPDRRRGVVHVMDVFEARQWELPIVYVCGMIERHFPQYHREDALLGDAARRRAGLKTSSDFQREERSLFDLAITRATRQVILSYPRFDENGDETLPSFFVEGTPMVPVDTRVRPRPFRSVPRLSTAAIRDAALLPRLAEKHRKLSPSSIESFLQCPFQFFARKTLRLRERPCPPRDRLDVLVQGSILHAALAAREQMPLLGSTVFDQIFEFEVEKRRIPTTYRTEAVRLEMLRHFQMFLDSPSFRLGWNPRVEEQFEIAVTPSLTVRGRIDRLEVGPHGEALVIDYKYSAAKTIRDRVKDQEEGEVVQSGLYLFAAVKQFGLTPAGMLYCGLKKKVEWGGWHVSLAGLESTGTTCTRDALDELTDGAAKKAAEASDSILSGRIEAHPRDESKCAWCDYRDICRIETQ
jgi:RecB family exonuclease